MSDNLNCNSCSSCNSCNSCNSCSSCDSCSSCNSCNSCSSCDSCNSCNSCSSCDYCYGLRQSEDMIFCKGEGKFESKGDGYHKQYCIFNVQITKDEFDEISVPSIKLEFDKDLSYDVRYKRAWNIAWNKLSGKEKKEFTDLPHFDKKLFFEITGISIDEAITEVTMSDVCKMFGKNVKIIKE